MQAVRLVTCGRGGSVAVLIVPVVVVILIIIITAERVPPALRRLVLSAPASQ